MLINLVIDTNIVISALIRKSFTRKLLCHPALTLFAPQILIVEIQKHQDLIQRKSKLTQAVYIKLQKSLLDHVISVPEEIYQPKLTEALDLIGHRDPKDVPFLALALSIKVEGIWSNDEDFKGQRKIVVFTTVDLIKEFDIYVGLK